MLNQRLKKKQRIRITGSSDRPRLTVFRSLNNLSAQLIDDATGKTLASANSIKSKGSRTVKAAEVGAAVAVSAKEKKIKRVVFDRNGYKYQGVVKVLADAARKAGLEF